MILYFVDGKVDCIETAGTYPDLIDAYNIDAADGVESCFDQLNEIDIELGQKENFTVISNFLPFLDQAETVYLYDQETKTFKEWDYSHFHYPNFESKVETYLNNLYTDW